MTQIIYGRHPVMAALRQPDSPLEEVIVAQGAGGRWLDEVKRLAELLPALNIENDPFLNGVAERLAASLAAEDAAALKDSPVARKAAVAEAGAILEELEAHG